MTSATTCGVPATNVLLYVGHVKLLRLGAGGADNRDVVSSESRFCIQCGAELDPAHRFCWNCGAARWSPGAPSSESAQPAERPAEPARAAPARAAVPARVDLGLLPWLYAAGAVFFLVWGTQALALVLAPAGQSQLLAEMARQGIPADMRRTVLLIYGIALIGAALAAAGLHAAAFYGLRRRRWWGWLAAVVVAGVWSLLIVGIPVLVRLVSRPVRTAFGVE